MVSLDKTVEYVMVESDGVAQEGDLYDDGVMISRALETVEGVDIYECIEKGDVC